MIGQRQRLIKESEVQQKVKEKNELEKKKYKDQGQLVIRIKKHVKSQ